VLSFRLCTFCQKKIQANQEISKRVTCCILFLMLLYFYSCCCLPTFLLTVDDNDEDEDDRDDVQKEDMCVWRRPVPATC